MKERRKGTEVAECFCAAGFTVQLLGPPLVQMRKFCHFSSGFLFTALALQTGRKRERERERERESRKSTQPHRER